MAAHRGHWTAGLRGLWCLGGGEEEGAPGGTEGKGAWLRWIYYPPLAAITNEIQCAITYVRRDIPAKVLSVFASIPLTRLYSTVFSRILSSSNGAPTRSFFFFGGGLDTSNRRTCCYLALFLVVRKYYRYCYFRYYCVRKYKWNMRLQNSIAS